MGIGLLAATAFLGSPLITSSPTFAQTPAPVLSSLTAAQRTQAAQVARMTEHVNTHNGYVSVNTTALAQHGLSPSQVAYVTSTIQQYDDQYGLTSTSIAPVLPLPSSVSTIQASTTPPLGDVIWRVWGDGRYVTLSEGTDTLGWQHMLYWHNWKNLTVAQTAVEITVHQFSGIDQAYRGTYYYKNFTTTVPFYHWYVTEMVAVGNTRSGAWNGYVKTGYPVAGNYTRKLWHGRKESINPWWVNVGLYAQKLE